MSINVREKKDIVEFELLELLIEKDVKQRENGATQS